jgi:hypothetical protein
MSSSTYLWQKLGIIASEFATVGPVPEHSSRRSSRAGAGTSAAEATVVGQVWGATLHAEELRRRTGVNVLAPVGLLWHLCVWTFPPFVHSVTRVVIFSRF